MALTPRNLQIKLLSRSGELLNVLNCAQGQITVLRALSHRELEPYRRAIAGITGPERFSVTIDDAPFRPEEHTLIGFGESYSAESRPLSELLLAAGAPEDSLTGMVLSYGLEDSLSKPASQLTPCEARRAQMLIGTLLPFRALVLHEPFEPISSQWRERFAELLVNFVKTQRGLVLITALSFRPECFIENPLISKIQVGENIQKTIGFASSSSAATSIVQQVRELLKEEEAKANNKSGRSGASQVPGEGVHRNSGSYPVSGPVDVGGYSAKPSRSGAPTTNTLLGGLAIVLLLTLAISRGWPPFSYFNETEGSVEPAQIVAVVPTPTPLPTQSQPPEALPPPTPTQYFARFALDKYPSNVKEALIKSFEAAGGQAVSTVGKGSVSSIQGDNPFAGIKSTSASPDSTAMPTLPPQGFSSGSELIQFLKAASGQQQNDAPSPPQFQPGPAEGEDQSEEQRREAIRQRFLEAITRASQNRRENEF